MWEQGHNIVRPVRDVNQEMLDFKGEYTEEEAKVKTAEFLYHNPAFFVRMLGRIRLFPMQEVIIKGWMENDYNLAVLGRGVSKSWSVAVFALIWAIFNPNCRIVVVSFAFRASRRILEQCEKFVNDKDATLLKACFPDKMGKKADEYRWNLPNGANITCLPLGDGTKIRGIRADVLIVDEFAYMPEAVIGEVLRPFLAANNKIKEQLELRERQDAMIARGEMTEDQRVVLDDRKKVIFLSSACFQFQHMYKLYLDWIDNITLPERAEKLKEGGLSYFVARMSWEAAPEGLLNKPEIEEARKSLSVAMFNREYGAEFTSDSDGYFRMAKIEECSVKDGETPCLELVGEKGAEYVIGIDPSMSGSETSDDFAMCVQKIVTRQDGAKIGMPVHFYAVAGGNLKDHILYLAWLLANFNVVWIAIDASQGDQVEFINSCNQSKHFKDRHIELSDIQADFKKDDFSELPKQIKRSYNRTAGRIVQKQPFSSYFQRAANEYLQACFDHKGILFGSRLTMANSSVISRALLTDISALYQHEGLNKELNDVAIKETKEPFTITSFIEMQGYLMKQTKDQCAMIQVKTTTLGALSFDLPQNVKRVGGANRVRRDSYSALFLCNWAVKLYLESLTVEVQTGVPDFPYGWIA